MTLFVLDFLILMIHIFYIKEDCKYFVSAVIGNYTNGMVSADPVGSDADGITRADRVCLKKSIIINYLLHL